MMAWADFGKTEKDYLNDVMDSGWLSRRTYIPRFEQEIARVHGQKYGMMTNSGTDALRIGLASLKEKYRWKDGAEVIVPAVTFVATVNVVLQNTLKPVFVDVDSTTYNIDTEKIEAKITSKTKAIIPVHLFGVPAEMDHILPITKKYNLKVLEDSCETMFVHTIKGDMAAFSTYMAHMIQTGVGGVLTTNDSDLDRLARSYMNHGRTDNPNRFEFERVGYSSRVTEMEAALGCAQLERRGQILQRRQEIAKRIWDGLSMDGSFPFSSWMLFPMMVPGRRDEFMAYMLNKGIETRQMMPLLNQPVYKELASEDDYPIAKNINANGVCLPCHQMLTDEDVDYMVNCVKEFFQGQLI